MRSFAKVAADDLTGHLCKKQPQFGFKHPELSGARVDADDLALKGAGRLCAPPSSCVLDSSVGMSTAVG